MLQLREVQADMHRLGFTCSDKASKQCLAWVDTGWHQKVRSHFGSNKGKQVTSQHAVPCCAVLCFRA
jgi:hypothetical protein